MDIIDDKMEEATIYRNRKEEQNKMRLQEVDLQVKAANLAEQLVYKVIQIRNPLEIKVGVSAWTNRIR